MYLRKCLIALACAGVLALSVGAPAHAALDLVPDSGGANLGPLFVVAGAPGQTMIASVQVSNSSSESLTAELDAAGLSSPDGQLQVDLDADTPATGWFSSDETELSIPAGEAIQLQARFAVPAGTEPGDYPAALVLTSVDATAQLPILIRVQGVREFDLQMPEVTTAVDGAGTWPATSVDVEMAYQIENTGVVAVVADLTPGLGTLFDGFVPVATTREVVLLPGSMVAGQGSAQLNPSIVMAPEVQLEIGYQGAAGEALTYTENQQGQPQWIVPTGLAITSVAIVVTGSVIACWIRGRARRSLHGTVN